MYFLTYEYVKELVAKEFGTDGSRALLGTIFAGGMAGIANWSIGMPADVLKSRLQTGKKPLRTLFWTSLIIIIINSKSAPEGTYKNGMRDVFRELMRNEGPRALYKGVTPVMLRAFPANAACFIGFEIAMKVLNIVAPNL